MTSPAFATRAQAESPPAELLRIMCRAHYEASRFTGSSRPPFEQTTSDWQDAMHRDMTAAIRAAEGAGMIVVVTAVTHSPNRASPAPHPTPEQQAQGVLDACHR